MSTTLKTLTDFLDAAEKNRKYPANTIYGIKAALKLFDNELTQEEGESFDTFKLHIDQIYQSVFSKNKSKISAASLETYKRRIYGLVSDYEKYGIDPTKMTLWEKPIRNRQLKSKAVEKNETPKAVSSNIQGASEVSINRVEITFNPGRKAIILVPFDITDKEAERIEGLIRQISK